jgi:RNA polymerase sigma-70 factor (ECF subfamily)
MKTRTPGSLSPGGKDMSEYSDEQLVMEALDGSHRAFGQLVKQYQYRVLRTIASIIGDEQAAQDLGQETFLSAWRNLAKLKEKEKFGRWLSRIAINLSKDWLRDQRKHQENTVSLEENVVLPTSELRYQSDKLRQEVWDAIDELAEERREVVILHYINGYSYEEISSMLSIPTSTIVGRLQKARNQLRKEFLDMVKKLQLEEVSKLTSGILCTSKGDVYLCDPSLKQIMNLTKGRIPDPWEVLASPDKKTVAIRSNCSERLYMIDMDSLSLRQTQPCLEYNAGLSWSPDSSKVAHGNINGIIDAENPKIVVRQVVVVDRKTMNVEVVAENTHPRDGLMWIQPKWSPNGKWIAYIGKRDVLALVSPDGSDKREIQVDGMSYELDYNVGLCQFEWSPDSKGLGVVVNGQWAIISLDGRIIQQVASEEQIKSWPKTGNPSAFWQKVGNYNEYLGVVDDNGNKIIFDVERFGGHWPVWL